MEQLKFLHFSDLHLDMPFSSLGPDIEKPSKRRKDLLEVFDRIIDLARHEKVDIILISGDFYEHYYVKKATIGYVNERFSELEHVKIIIVPGNHDPYISNSYYKGFRWSSNVYILSEDNPFIEFEDLGACVYGVGFKSFYEEKAVLNNLKPVDEMFINILLIHGTVDMNFKKSLYNSVTSAELSLLGMDYIAAGHFHKRMDDIGSKGVIYNPGSPEPLGFDEEGEHGVFIGKIKRCGQYKKSLELTYRNTNKRIYKSLEIRVEASYSGKQILDRIKEVTSSINGQDTLVNLVVKGYVDPHYRIDLNRIINELMDDFFYVSVEDLTLPEYDYEEIASGPGLKGAFARKMLKLINDAPLEKDKYLLMKAFHYGLEALDQGKIEVL